eukprot:CAMPEP_0168748648 /NCGR_PEP_ID=MMETSP0724-20121128/16286_1 /TAXON_ID=265536 /ORGANISM="Amphiprora sp., Strain CCMP467" /LENGTH=498 /DNA_ID=CAMNT_0008796487 /DNA_START=358 /DNA_END=1854 /DNA_ORIENTATION=-
MRERLGASPYKDDRLGRGSSKQAPIPSLSRSDRIGRPENHRTNDNESQATIGKEPPFGERAVDPPPRIDWDTTLPMPIDRTMPRTIDSFPMETDSEQKGETFRSKPNPCPTDIPDATGTDNRKRPALWRIPMESDDDDGGDDEHYHIQQKAPPLVPQGHLALSKSPPPPIDSSPPPRQDKQTVPASSTVWFQKAGGFPKVEFCDTATVVTRSTISSDGKSYDSQPSKASGLAPKATLYTWLNRPPMRIVAAAENYVTWDNGGRPHEIKYAAVFVHPRTGECFLSQRFGHGAAARAYDCLFYREHVEKARPNSHPSEPRMGEFQPYTEPRILPPSHAINIPSDALNRIVQAKKKATGKDVPLELVQDQTPPPPLPAQNTQSTIPDEQGQERATSNQPWQRRQQQQPSFASPRVPHHDTYANPYHEQMQHETNPPHHCGGNFNANRFHNNPYPHSQPQGLNHAGLSTNPYQEPRQNRQRPPLPPPHHYSQGYQRGPWGSQ